MGQGLFRKYSDKDLVEGIRLQDTGILNFLYKAYLPMVKNHVLKNSGDLSDVSEVLQEGMIILYKQISNGELELSSDLKAYFFGIARLVWNSLLRQKQRHFEIAADIADDADSPYDNEGVIMERIVARAMSKLKPDCRETILMFSRGAGYAEIAATLGFKSEEYARRKKYLCKEALLDLIKADPEYRDQLDLK